MGEIPDVELSGNGEPNCREKGSRLDGAMRAKGFTGCRGREIVDASGTAGCTGAAKDDCDKSIRKREDGQGLAACAAACAFSAFSRR